MKITHIVALLWFPDADVLRCETFDLTCLVNETGSCTAGTYIDAEVVSHGCWSSLRPMWLF